MKVLIAAGVKTNNIVNPLRERFTSGAIALSSETNVDGIFRFIHKGEIFDRAIIVEPAIMGDFGSSDYESGREKIIKLLEIIRSSNNSGAQFIFVVTNTELANVIMEEMFELGSEQVKIIVNKAKFKLKFFIELCTLELSEIKDIYESISTAKTVENTVDVNGDSTPLNAQAPEYEHQGYEEVKPEPQAENNVGDISSFDPSNIGDYPEPPAEYGDGDPETGEYDDKLETIEEVQGNENEPDEVVETGGESDFSMLNAGTTEFENPENVEYKDNGLGDVPEETFAENAENADLNGDNSEENFEEMFDNPENTEYTDPGFLPAESIENPQENQENQENQFNEEDNTDFIEEETNPENSEYTDRGFLPAENIENVENIDNTTSFDDMNDGMYENNEDDEINNSAVEESAPVIPVVPLNNGDNNDVNGNTVVNGTEYFGDMYDDESDDSIMTHMSDTNVQMLQKMLSAGQKNLVFTGVPGGGKTTMAYNVAMLIARLGFTTLYVDCDTETRGVSYIDTKVYNWVHTDDDTVSSLAHAMGNSANIIAYAGVVIPGLHVLTLGLDQDTVPLDRVGTISREKIHRFSSMAKQNYQFVIYDVPFKQLHNCACDLAYLADKLIYITEASTRGLIKMMLDIADVEEDDFRQLFIKKTYIVLNKYHQSIKIFNKDMKSASKILRELDGIIYEVVGGEVSDRFEAMNILQTLPIIPDINNYWFSKKAYVETENGLKLIGGFLKNILEA